MSKKTTAKKIAAKKPATKKSATKRSQRPAAAEAAANTEATEVAEFAEAAEGAPVEAGDESGHTSRLPPVGTVIKKLDRHGTVRCQCTVTEAGIRYRGRVFGSLSGAAMAAAKDLGLENKTQNGYTFWGLTKPTRKLDDPKAALQKGTERLQQLAAEVLKSAPEASRAELRALLEAHESVVQGLLGEAA